MRSIRKATVLLVCFAFVGLVRAASPNVKVEGWRFDAARSGIIISLVNTSGKNITAFNVHTVKKFEDGSALASDDLTDYLPMVANVQATQNEELRRRHGDGNWASGAAQEVFFPTSAKPTDVQITVDMIAFSDATVIHSNPMALHTLKQIREDLMDRERKRHDSLSDDDEKVKSESRMAVYSAHENLSEVKQ